MYFLQLLYVTTTTNTANDDVFIGFSVFADTIYFVRSESLFKLDRTKIARGTWDKMI